LALTVPHAVRSRLYERNRRNIGYKPEIARSRQKDEPALPIDLTAPLGNIITNDGRVDVKSLAQKIDLTMPTIAKALGKSVRYLHEKPTARSIQPRALLIVDRVNSLASELGGVNYAVAWLNTPTPELGGKSTMDLITSGEDRSFEVALGFIDSYLTATPD
jgi:hypothetical protein